MKVREAGLFVSVSHPFLGASPDGLIGDSHTLEIKCPYRGREEIIQPGPSFPFLQKMDDAISLKQSSKYFDQIQGQMAITGCHKAYLAVFTFVDFIVMEVPFDEEYWKTAMLPKLSAFYYASYRKHVAAKL